MYKIKEWEADWLGNVMNDVNPSWDMDTYADLRAIATIHANVCDKDLTFTYCNPYISAVGVIFLNLRWIRRLLRRVRLILAVFRHRLDRDDCCCLTVSSFNGCLQMKAALIFHRFAADFNGHFASECFLRKLTKFSSGISNCRDNDLDQANRTYTWSKNL
ncbi:hypothetical protein TcasGA2_TC001333 [Tribolium castaneum]|uniref:Uncharacterized protein n=1 Tax=Tribolium castaneum TaxID=7070 RepID=D6WC69_TRICA|nr:hypothetical protein TcasGA2_TC001333 [Tribolium castaneum]